MICKQHLCHVFPGKRKSSAYPNTTADNETLEKRWKHEQLLQEKELEMEKERLALEKIKLEFKQQRFLRRQEVKQHKIDKEFKLRELEIDIKAKEIEQKETLNQLYQRYQQETVSLVKTLVQRCSQ